MSDNSKNDINRPRRVHDLAKDLADLCYERQQYHAQKSQEFGYARDIFTDIKDIYLKIPSNEPLLGSLESSLTKFKQFVQAKQDLQTDVSSSAYFFGTSTAVTGSFFDPSKKIFETYDIPKPPSFWPRDRVKLYASKLDKLDNELGRVYRSIWTSLLGNQENPERAAMYQMRQAYDHFFDILAPDKTVRESPYFQQKTEGDPNTVSRKERLHYAANTKIKDNNLKELLLAQDDYIIKLYKKLNKAHKPGAIDSREAKETLNAMRTVLEEWIDAIEI